MLSASQLDVAVYSLEHGIVHSTPSETNRQASHQAATMTSPPGTRLDTLTAPWNGCKSNFYGNSPTTWCQTLMENISHISYTFNSEGTRDRVYLLP